MRAEAARLALGQIAHVVRSVRARVTVGSAMVLCAVLGTGCVASIHELRIPGPDRPTEDARAEVDRETRDGPTVVSATPDGASVDAAVERVTECRDVTVVRSMVRNVEVVRTFGDDAQERNMALSFLVTTALGLVALAANQPVCAPTQPGCSVGAATAVETALAGLAAVPLGFAATNAFRAMDRRIVEPAPPRLREGTWAPCTMRPLPGEAVDVSIGDKTQRVTTGADGHAFVDVTSLLAGMEPAARRAIVRHVGSPDVEVFFPVPAKAP